MHNISLGMNKLVDHIHHQTHWIVFFYLGNTSCWSIYLSHQTACSLFSPCAVLLITYSVLY